MNTRNEWVNFFKNAFERVKEMFKEAYQFEDEEEISPGLLALRDAVFSLPCAVKILELEVDTTKCEHIEDDVCQIVTYNFSKLGKVSVEYFGIIKADEREKLRDVFYEKLGLDKKDATEFAESLCRDFRTTGIYYPNKPDCYLQFTFFNIRKKPEKYIRELFSILTLPGYSPFVEKFKKEEPDWNALYCLEEDPILPFSKIVQEDPILEGFVGFATIEKVQKMISDIQLIPTVPEDVKRVFNRAKDLFVYGYFKYSFFTISEHYSFLALESAIRHRYIKSLGAKVILTDRKKRLYFEMSSPSYERIWEFCIRNKKAGWSAHRLLVNGEPFPYKTRKILDWLVDKKILTKWERKQYDAGIFLRNSLSHLEHASIIMPNSEILRRVAENINKLFHEKTEV